MIENLEWHTIGNELKREFTLHFLLHAQVSGHGKGAHLKAWHNFHSEDVFRLGGPREGHFVLWEAFRWVASVP